MLTVHLSQYVQRKSLAQFTVRGMVTLTKYIVFSLSHGYTVCSVGCFDCRLLWSIEGYVKHTQQIGQCWFFSVTFLVFIQEINSLCKSESNTQLGKISPSVSVNKHSYCFTLWRVKQSHQKHAYHYHISQHALLQVDFLGLLLMSVFLHVHWLINLKLHKDK